ncbi:MAG: PQQ-binding-like beta-propeller repeat protein [Armatimonadetes bacterium]|nr:PQQ-binding-like beta-propeller repeat protein [Armatimonadota bacterium]
MSNRGLAKVLLAVVLTTAVLLTTVGQADPWTTWRHDARHSGVSPEQLPASLHLQWTYTPAHPPATAWPEPGRELNRIDFDYVFHVSVGHGLAFFGSSADHKVYALDLATGDQRWVFFTGAPVRFAPTLAGDRVLVASDDGWLYCLAAQDGKLLWRFHAAPGDDLIFGNEQLISRWPLRSGVAVDGDVVYVTAGMWPAEHVFLYALRLADGAILWKNDELGKMFLDQPHPPSQAMTGVAPQGYLSLDDKRIYIPTGRNVPAAFDRATGKFLYYRSRPYTWGDRWGGCWTFTGGGLLFNRRSHIGPDINSVLGESQPWKGDGLIAFEATDGARKFEIKDKLCAILKGDTLYASGGGKVAAYDFKALTAGKKPQDCIKWQSDHGRAYTLVLAGDTLLVGGKGTVTAFSATDGHQLWQKTVPAEARGIAVAEGHVLVSSTDGTIQCFAGAAVVSPRNVSGAAQARQQYGEGRASDPSRVAWAAQQARRILADAGVTEGYCLCLGAGEGLLAKELVKQSKLKVFCLEPDPAKVAAARAALDAEGLYGPRVVVQQGSMEKLPYPDYFANLIVLGPTVAPDLKNCSAAELYRVLRPCGGVAYLGRDPATDRARAAQVRAWLWSAGVPSEQIKVRQGVVTVVRGSLPGAGEWTHQYADAGRSGASKDKIVRLPLKVLWFGKPGPAIMVSRHWRGPAPLSINGRLFVIGQNRIVAVDAYNGRQLWAKDLPGVGRFPVISKGGNAAVDDANLFAVVGNQCVCLDQLTGETKLTYEMPPLESLSSEEAAKLYWDYMGLVGDYVVGTAAIGREGRYLFALAKKDGKVAWIYKATDSITHDSVALADGVVYLIDKTSSAKLSKMKRRGEAGSARGKLVALDAATGKVLWQTTRGLSQRYELRYASGILLATGNGRLSVFSAKDGKRLSWSEVRMRTFPVVVGDTIYGEPYAYDLHTGKRKMRVHPLTLEKKPWFFRRSYGCGSVAAAPNLLAFRSGTMGFYDIADDSGLYNYGGVRAGCYVNTIAANGLVLAPPADAGCTCSYNFQTTIALMPTDRREEWAVFTGDNLRPGEKVRAAALNLGALGDRRAPDHTLWLGFPRPRSPLAMKVPFVVEVAEGGDYYRENADMKPVAGTDVPWLYTSGVEGIRTAVLDVVQKKEGEPVKAEPRTFTVRLFFAEPEALRSGERVFDVKLQGKVVEEGLDVMAVAGAARKPLVREYRGVAATDAIELEFVPRGSKLPILCAIQVIEEGK